VWIFRLAVRFHMHAKEFRLGLPQWCCYVLWRTASQRLHSSGLIRGEVERKRAGGLGLPLPLSLVCFAFFQWLPALCVHRCATICGCDTAAAGAVHKLSGGWILWTARVGILAQLRRRTKLSRFKPRTILVAKSGAGNLFFRFPCRLSSRTLTLWNLINFCGIFCS
jgi:hypothetical protein